MPEAAWPCNALAIVCWIRRERESGWRRRKFGKDPASANVFFGIDDVELAAE
jgi:hypothetical protein